MALAIQALQTQGETQEQSQTAPPVFDHKRLTAARDELIATRDDETSRYLASWIDAMLEGQAKSRTNGGSRRAVVKAFRNCLRKAGITQGRIAELGGPHNSDASEFPDYDWEWLSLYPDPGNEAVRVCDICHADHIESDRYDAVFSVSVMEHVAEPWKAAEHIKRILKPGGIVFHSAPFSYFYHGAPADFWRYTPDGFRALFPGLRPIMGEFFADARRRDNRGTEFNAVTRDGGESFAPDAFGGWRENWATLYCGMKSPKFEWQKRKTCERQLVVDLMRQYVRDGMKCHQAARRVVDGLRELELDDAFALVPKQDGSKGINLSPLTCVQLYRNRAVDGPQISHSTFVSRARFEHLLKDSDCFRGPDAPGS